VPAKVPTPDTAKLFCTRLRDSLPHLGIRGQGRRRLFWGAAPVHLGAWDVSPQLGGM